jgi:hypothetical protein
MDEPHLLTKNSKSDTFYGKLISQDEIILNASSARMGHALILFR